MRLLSFSETTSLKNHEININFSTQTTKKQQTIVNVEPMNVFN